MKMNVKCMGQTMTCGARRALCAGSMVRALCTRRSVLERSMLTAQSPSPPPRLRRMRPARCGCPWQRRNGPRTGCSGVCPPWPARRRSYTAVRTRRRGHAVRRPCFASADGAPTAAHWALDLQRSPARRRAFASSRQQTRSVATHVDKERVIVVAATAKVPADRPRRIARQRQCFETADSTHMRTKDRADGIKGSSTAEKHNGHRAQRGRHQG